MKWGLYIINRDMHATSYAPYPSSKWALLPTKKALRAIQNVLYALKWGVYIIKKDMHGTSYAPYLSSKYNCKAPHNERVLLSIKRALFANTYSQYAFKWALYTINSFMRDMTHSRVTWLIHTGCRWLRCVWMSHVTYECVTRWPDLFVLVTWLLHAWHDPLIYASLFMHVWMDSFMCEILDIRHDSFLIHTVIYASLFMTHSCVTWLMHVSHDPFTCDSCATWLMHMWHDTFICDITHPCVTWLIHLQHDSFQWEICSYATTHS